MTVRRILRIDQPDDLAVLTAKSVRIKTFDNGLRRLVEDLFETLASVSGYGLAAPQIGVLRRVAVIEEPSLEEGPDGEPPIVSPPPRRYVLVNPEIKAASPERITVTEGCLSLPGVLGEVLRHAWVTIDYQDLDGKPRRLQRRSALDYQIGHTAQHEIDHLNGVLFTAHLTDLGALRDYRRRR